MIQMCLWIFDIYVDDIVLIPSVFKEYKVMQFGMYFLFVFHQLCMMRNLFKAMCTIPSTKAVDKTDEVDRLKNYDQCKKCSKLRPKRSHHCSICEKCIDKMDHHCHILNNCIGRQNYRFFFSYIFLTCLNALMSFFLSFYVLYAFRNEVISEASKAQSKLFLIQYLFKLPIRALLLFLLSIITFLTMIYFLLYHLWLLSKDQTTIERKYPGLQIKNVNKMKRTMKERISRMLHSSNWFDIYWPD